jgi:glycogen synthase kinase 3 beta
MASATAAVASSTKMIGGGAALTKAGSSGVESLPKEMNEMKLRDDKADHGDDKVRPCFVVRSVACMPAL